MNLMILKDNLIDDDLIMILSIYENCPALVIAYLRALVYSQNCQACSLFAEEKKVPGLFGPGTLIKILLY
jgi:hypothetical protein